MSYPSNKRKEYSYKTHLLINLLFLKILRVLEIARRDLNLLLDLSNRQMSSLLMLEACLFREESRGGHFRDDFPTSVPFWQCHTRQIKGKNIHTRPLGAKAEFLKNL